jgi:hypothetical protein
MARLIVVSNRVALPDQKAPTGGLAVGVLAALKGAEGGIWFGWSGKTQETPGSSGFGLECRHNLVVEIDRDSRLAGRRNRLPAASLGKIVFSLHSFSAPLWSVCERNQALPVVTFRPGDNQQHAVRAHADGRPTNLA